MSKNKRTTLTTLLLLVISGAFQQCMKIHDPTMASKESVVGTYRLSALTTKDNNGAVIDLYASLDNCQKDDKFQFDEDGSYARKDAGTSCTPTTDHNGSWSQICKQITFAGFSADIISADGKKIVLSFDGTAMGGFPNPVIETLIKQY